MSFKAKKTALCVGLCFLGMISAQQPYVSDCAFSA